VLSSASRRVPLAAMNGHALFLSYNRADRHGVVAVQKLLAARGITTFLDRDQLVPGLPWPKALEEGLRGVRAVAVFIGRELGGWQKREMWFALDRQVREEKQGHPFPVIPVLLAGADLTPSFLFTNTWIDFRGGLDTVSVAEPLQAFEHAINVSTCAPPQLADRAAALCPYRGLEAFREEHAAFFAGRAAFASELFKFTVGRELVAVVGPSGSGKSSVVQAGLVPLLRRQLPPKITWDVITFTPGTDPFLRLASALAPLLEQDKSETDRLAEAHKLGKCLNGDEIRLESVIDRVIEKSNGTGRLLVVADQFEELFTLTPEPSRQPFARALVQALGKAHFTLLVTLRADFYSQIITLDRELSDRLAPAQVNIGALTRDELQESIIKPAKLVGLEFEPGLVDRILHDVGSEPGNLPLLEFALTGLWSKRQNRTLTNAAYDEIGGVTGALAQRAETVFAQFAPEEQTAAHRLLSRLVRVARPEEGAEDTRQRIELQATDPVAEKVALTLAGPEVRLLVMGRPEGEEQSGNQTVEVAHEALIRNWGRLRGWLNEDREFLLWRQRLQIQVEQWDEHERDASYFLRGVPLSEAERWLLGRPQELMAAEQQFIKESVDLREQEHEAEERRRSDELARLRRTRVIIAATAVVFSSLCLLATYFWWTSRQQRNLALARQLAADSELLRKSSPDWTPATLLAIESLQMQETVQGYEALWLASSTMGREVVRKVHGGPVDEVAFSPDGDMVATGSRFEKTERVFEVHSGMVRFSSRASLQLPEYGSAVAFNRDGTLVAFGSDEGHVFDVRTKQEVAHLGDTSVRAMAFSPDGRLIAISTNYLIPRVWDTSSGQDIARLPNKGPVLAMAFSPDGALIATASKDGTARVFEARTGREVSKLEHGDAVIAVAFSSDGTLIATASKDKTARVFETRTGREVARLAHGDAVVAVAFSPDNTLVATASWDKTARVFEAHSGREVSRLVHGDFVVAAAFSPNGVLVATGSGDKTARVFEARSGREVSRLAHGNDVVAVAFSPDSTLVATASWDNTARVFEARTRRDLTSLAQARPVSGGMLSPDGTLVASTSGDTTQVFESRTGRELYELHGRTLNAVAFSPDGTLVAITSDDKTARVFEVRTGRELSRLVHGNAVVAVAFSPDGRLVATASEDKTVRVFEARGGTNVALLAHDSVPGWGFGMTFSPDSTLVATISGETTQVFESRTGRQLARYQLYDKEFHGRTLNAVAFSPDGTLVAIASDDKTARVFEARTGLEVARLTHGDSVVSIAFSPKGTLLATASQDKTARVFEARTGREVARLTHGDSVISVAFSPDGALLATGSQDKIARVFEARTGREVARVPFDQSIQQLAFVSPCFLRAVTGETSLQITQDPVCASDLVAEACSKLTRNLTRDEWKDHLGVLHYRETCQQLNPAVAHKHQ
jgi:WD40 repeat protein